MRLEWADPPPSIPRGRRKGAKYENPTYNDRLVRMLQLHPTRWARVQRNTYSIHAVQRWVRSNDGMEYTTRAQAHTHLKTNGKRTKRKVDVYVRYMPKELKEEAAQQASTQPTTPPPPVPTPAPPVPAPPPAEQPVPPPRPATGHDPSDFPADSDNGRSWWSDPSATADPTNPPSILQQ